jgi:hypothetical protein
MTARSGRLRLMMVLDRTCVCRLVAHRPFSGTRGHYTIYSFPQRCATCNGRGSRCLYCFKAFRAGRLANRQLFIKPHPTSRNIAAQSRCHAARRRVRTTHSSHPITQLTITHNRRKPTTVFVRPSYICIPTSPTYPKLAGADAASLIVQFPLARRRSLA